MYKMFSLACSVGLICLFFMFGLLACSTAEPSTAFSLTTTTTINGTHAATHADNGSDEISVTDLSGLLADGQTPLAHNASHESGGSDTINITGLAGLLADGQTPLGHNTSHELGGSDTINVTGLAGAGGGGSGIENVVEDLTPELGGDLDLASNDVYHEDTVRLVSESTANNFEFKTTSTNNDMGVKWYNSDDSVGWNASYINFIYTMMTHDIAAHNYGRFLVWVDDSTTSSTDSEFWWYLRNGGSENQVMTIDGVGNLWVDGDMSALTITDRTKYFSGNATEELIQVKGVDGEIDHNTIPEFARVERTREIYDDNMNLIRVDITQERDLGAMISMLTVSTKELNARILALEAQIITLEARLTILEEGK